MYQTEVDDIWSKIALTSSLQPVITTTDTVGSLHFRTICIRDVAGNWTTHRVAEWGSETYKYLAFNGMKIDGDDNIHLAWVDIRAGAIRYLRMGLDGTIRAGPLDVCMLLPSNGIEWIKIDIIVTLDGDLLFTWNPSPMCSSHISPNWATPAIDMAYAPKGAFEPGTVRTARLVDVPTVSEFVTYMDEDGNTFLFWMDHRTGVTQVYMKHLARPGMTFRLDPLVWASSSYIRPGETKVVPMELANVGTVGYDAAIYLETNASPWWDLGLDRYRGRLRPSSSLPVNLTVTCPANASDGESIVIWVNATTFGGELTANIRLIMYVKWERELTVACSRSYQLVDPGGTAGFRVSLQNTGELPEEVLVSVMGTGPPRWSFSPPNASLSLARDEATHVDLSVTAPADAREDDVHTLLLTFTWADGNTAHQGVVLRTVVRPTFFVTMELNRTEATVRPGGEVSFNVTVGNVGNMKGTAYVEVTILTNPGEWTVLISSETVVLTAGERRVLQLLVCAPSDAAGGDLLVLRLRAYCPDPFSEVERDARVAVARIHDLRWTDGPLEMSIWPGREGSAPVEVTNGGNLYETVRFRMDGLGDGWTWRVERDGEGTAGVRLGSGEVATLDLRVGVPDTAQAGTRRMRLYVELDEFTVGHLDVEVSVMQLGEVELRAVSSRAVVYPGGCVQGTIEVFNRGNGPEAVSLSCTSEHVSSVTFVVDGQNATEAWVPAGSSRTVVVRWRVSDDCPLGEGNLTVRGASRRDPGVGDGAVLGYQVVSPEVRVVAVEVAPPRPDVNEVTVVTVRLCNEGPLEVVDIRVTMEGGEEERIASIAPGGETTAVFTWVPLRPGREELGGEIRYGPGNHTIPWSRVVDTREEEPVVTASLAILTAIVVVAAAVLTVVVIRARPRSGDNVL